MTSLLHRDLRAIYPQAVKAEGTHIWDADGRRYLDLAGQAAVNFIGHRDPTVVKAIVEQAARVEFVHSSQFTTAIAESYAAELLDFCGPDFAGGAVFFTSGGSEAVETAMKLARQFHVEHSQPKRTRFISRQQAYHGATLGALAVSGNRKRRDMYLPLMRIPEQFLHIGLPYCYRCAYRCQDCGNKYAKELELAISESRGDVAAFIAEPISGATLGAAVPPADYLPRVAEICRTHKVLFIADEVMTGCGRTGRNLALHHWNVAPDMIVLAKGLTSGYLPLGAVVVSRHIVDVLRAGSGTLKHGFTYNAHPLSCAAGAAVFRVMREKNLIATADEAQPGSVAAVFRQELQTLRELPQVGDVRGLGLLRAVEFVAERESKKPFAPSENVATRIAEAARKRGVLTYPMQGCVDGLSGDHLLLAPPAVVTPAQLREAVGLLAEAITETVGKG